MIKKFKRSLILYSFFGILITGLAIAFVGITPLTKKMKENEKSDLAHLAQMKGKEIDNYLHHIKGVAAQIGSRTRIREVLEEYNAGKLTRDELVSFTVPKLTDGFQHWEEIVGAARFDQYGNLLFQVKFEIPASLFYLPPETVLTPVIKGPVLVDEHYYLVISSPILNRLYNRVGTDIFLVHTQHLENLVTDLSGLGESGVTLLGMVEAKQPVQFFLSGKQPANASGTLLTRPEDALLANALLQSSELRQNSNILVDQGRIVASYKIKNADWIYLTTIDTKELFASINNQILHIGIVITFLLIAGLLILLSLMRPLAKTVLIHTDKLQQELDEKELALDQLARAERIRKLNEERMESLLNLYQLTDKSSDDLIALALEEGVRLTGSEVGYLHFYDENTKEVHFSTWSSETLKQCTLDKEGHFPLEKAGIWADSLRTNNVAIHNDYQSIPGKKGYPEGHFPVKRHMSVPISDGETIEGVVGVGNKEESYDESDVRQLTLYMNNMLTIIKQKQMEQEKEHLHVQLMQAQKMEVVGRFSGGIAHDFNNLLSTILGYSEYILKRIPEKETFYRNLVQLIFEAGEQGATLTKQLLAFSRKQVIDPKVIVINEIVEKMTPLLEGMVGDDIKLKMMSENSKLYVNADIGQIEQVIMNMAINAKDAMPDGGTFTIAIDELTLDKNTEKLTDIGPGNYIVLSFADTGVGMDELVKEKIFEPFYTTKSLGQGTGLGLSTIFGIIQQHQGHISVDSKPGK